MKLRIIVENPPPGVTYALQKGKGAQYAIEQMQRSTGAALAFEFEVRYENSDCYGPYVQGPKGQRFVYINIGTCAGQHASPWTRRLKVPLGGFTHDGSYEARVPGTDRKGEPACATVKPFTGWKPAP